MFLSEYLVDLKSWSVLQDLEPERNGRGQRAKWAWLKNSHTLCAHSITKNPPLINPGSAPVSLASFMPRFSSNEWSWTASNCNHTHLIRLPSMTHCEVSVRWLAGHPRSQLVTLLEITISRGYHSNYEDPVGNIPGHSFTYTDTSNIGSSPRLPPV